MAGLDEADAVLVLFKGFETLQFEVCGIGGTGGGGKSGGTLPGRSL